MKTFVCEWITLAGKKEQFSLTCKMGYAYALAYSKKWAKGHGGEVVSVALSE